MNTEKRLYLACKALLTPWAEDAVAASLEAERQAREAMNQYEFNLGPIPDWAVAHNITDELVPGLQLFTKHSRRHGNAHITSKTWAQAPGTGGGVFYYNVITDAGTPVFDMTESEVLEGWEPGDFISDPAAVMKRFGRGHAELPEPE